MQRSQVTSLQGSQAGGITILVALMLLVLLTVGAMGMSRNALRELVITGTSRQGSMARNVADSGIEWAIYWLDDANGAKAAGSALQLRTLKSKLAQDPTLAGKAYNPIGLGEYPATRPNPETDLTLGGLTNTTQGYSIGLTYMGKLPLANMSQGAGPGAFAPAQGTSPNQAPDLWALRSDSQIQVGTGTTATKFFHSKEAWISTPPGN
jgi:hypothetical protein